MSRAVFVLDKMPENCLGCLALGHPDISCRATGIPEKLIYDPYERPDWCPLKELPDRVPENHLTKEDFDREFYDSCFAFDCGHAQGWNDCLDVIFGKEDTDGQTEDL